jgi:hypothetical protein
MVMNLPSELEQNERRTAMRIARETVERLEASKPRWFVDESDEQRVARLDRERSGRERVERLEREASGLPAREERLIRRWLETAPESPPAAEPRADVPETTWEAWVNHQIDERMRWMLESAGEFIGDALADARRESRDELRAEVQRLNAECQRLFSIVPSLQKIIQDDARERKAIAAIERLEALPVESQRAN